MSSGDIVIAGDAPLDEFVYPSLSGPEPCDSPRDLQKIRTHRYRGGATLIAEFLRIAAPECKFEIHEPSFDGSESGTPKDSVRSIIEFDVHTSTTQDALTLKMKRKQHLDVQPVWYQPKQSAPSGDNVNLLILPDAEGYFSNSADAIGFLRKLRPHLLLYHMTCPLASGEIWETVRNGPYVRDNKQDLENIIVIVSADDLRAEGIELSHGLSWEKTCEDFVEKLGSVGKLVTLVTCAHLIVLFGCDGVIYHRGLQVARPTLFFDPVRAEGELIRQNLGYLPGLTEAFIAGLATKLAQSQTTALDEGIEFGLSAMRRLAGAGLILSPNRFHVPVYPVHQVMDGLCQDECLLRFSIPSNDIGSGANRNWSILDHTVGDPAEVARQIVKKGARSSASQIPLAQFGRLVLVDRHEIESFRTLFNLLQEYLEVPHSKPISIALFGPKGSGKSFAAMQVAETLSAGRRIRKFRFDLTESTSLEDLIAAFHSVRDCNLEGNLPLIFINGFDAGVSGSPLHWLPHLLAPMLQGRFLDHGVSRPIGPAIFFFGATVFKSYEDFQRRAAAGTGNLTGAEEFLGCLHGFVNMLGPNCVSDHDRLYPVRRAAILRALLEEREPNLKVGEDISIDEGVLDGLLMVPTYRQGIRSLKSIIAMSRLNGCRHFERAALPPGQQLDLHVEYEAFMKYMSGRILPDSIRELLAEQLHDTYLQQRLRMASTDTERQEIKNQEWSHLGEEFRESARAHADDIPRKLRIISCFLAETQGHRIPVTEFEGGELEELAESEHDRWNTERLQKQWYLGDRDPAVRRSPLLIPWSDLAQEWRDVDRAMVECYPKILPPGYKIYRMGRASDSKEMKNTMRETR